MSFQRGSVVGTRGPTAGLRRASCPPRGPRKCHPREDRSLSVGQIRDEQGDRLDVLCHGEQIEPAQGRDAPTGRTHMGDIAPERRWVACDVGDRTGAHRENPVQDFGTCPAARRVKHDDVDRLDVTPREPGVDRALMDPYLREVVEVATSIAARVDR